MKRTWHIKVGEHTWCTHQIPCEQWLEIWERPESRGRIFTCSHITEASANDMAAFLTTHGIENVTVFRGACTQEPDYTPTPWED